VNYFSLIIINCIKFGVFSFFDGTNTLRIMVFFRQEVTIIRIFQFFETVVDAD